MSRFNSKHQAEILKSRNRQIKLVKLLDAFDWKLNGYTDKFAWMSTQYGPGHDADLLIKCQEQFEQEDLL